jgi:L-aspartate oxidase
MWNYVGIVRRIAASRVRSVASPDSRRNPRILLNFLVTAFIELRNLVTVAELIIRCASMRRESRGLHYTLDYPDVDDVNWRCDTIVRLGQ